MWSITDCPMLFEIVATVGYKVDANWLANAIHEMKRQSVEGLWALTNPGQAINASAVFFTNVFLKSIIALAIRPFDQCVAF